MDASFSRRGLFQGAAAVGTVAAASAAAGPVARVRQNNHPGWVFGRMTGAEALVEALKLEGVGCVYGIPGAQENELWDTFKDKDLPYLLVTHEFSAACMADAYVRSTGRPGVLCVVPGPGLTNSLTGIGEALLDGVPLVCVVGDVARGDKYRPFQVHELPNVDRARSVTLVENMVITADPGTYTPGWGGMRVEDNVLVTAHGPEVLSKASRRLV